MYPVRCGYPASWESALSQADNYVSSSYVKVAEQRTTEARKDELEKRLEKVTSSQLELEDSLKDVLLTQI